MSHDAFRITGANAGLGKDVAPQLALRDDVGNIYLASRSEARARAAQSDLRQATGRAYDAIHAFLRAPSDEERQT